MQRSVATPLVVVGFGAVLALGFAVAALASSSSSAAPASTSETTTTTHKTTTTTTPPPTTTTSTTAPASTTTPTSTTERNTTARFAAKLGARAEVPKPKGASAGASGTFAVTLSDNGTNSMTWKLTFSKLTGKAVAAHIHGGRPGKAGSVLLALCGPCRSGQTGRATLSHAVGNAIRNGSAYVNVRTARNAAGEIRGQIAKVR